MLEQLHIFLCLKNIGTFKHQKIINVGIRGELKVVRKNRDV
jgi:hypothetical protein